MAASLIKERNYAAALQIWTGWHDQGKQMKDSYVRFVELSNEGARDLGYAARLALAPTPTAALLFAP